MLRKCLAAIACLTVFGFTPARAHEGHIHDKPPVLNLPVAPRVVAVTPELELVGVSSGGNRLTIFLHAYASNEPIKGARIDVSAGENSAAAKPEGDGVFTISAPWLDTAKGIDLVFALTLADGTQDLLTGRLSEVASTQTSRPPASASAWQSGRLLEQPVFLLAAAGGLMAGILLTMLVLGARRRGKSEAVQSHPHSEIGEDLDRLTRAAVEPQRRQVGAGVSILIVGLLIGQLVPEPVRAADDPLPSIPPTMATDLAQRMPDGTLFVPKATQHLLGVRTRLTARGDASRSVELTGTIIPGPEHFGRVQPGRPGRIEAAPGGLAFVGKRVEKGQLLGYVRTYIEAADRANMDSMIAETEGRIEKLKTILSRYDKLPGSVPQVKVDEVRGELQALTRKRAELLPAAGSREPIIAPIGGIVSVANATIGQIVEARDVLFEIVDPSEFWVEAIAYDREAVSQPEKAVAIAGGGEQIPLTFAGRGLVLRQQATVLTFRITGTREGLAIGMPVKVVVQSRAKVDGFVIPASSVVRGQTGLPIVWVKTEAERFEPQTVKVAPLDGTSIVITAGLKDDMRVVTNGVTLLNQVR